jgi:Flp pilus assembly protein TadG
MSANSLIVTRKPTPTVRYRGGVYIMVLFALPVILGFVTFCVDLGAVTVARSEMHAALDAATLAGATGLQISPAEARRRARETACQNSIANSPLLLDDSDIELGTWDAATRTFVKLPVHLENQATTIRITGSRTQARGNQLPLTIAPILGLGSIDLTTSRVAGFSPSADVVLVQDITGSFAGELADAKKGDQALLDSLYAQGNTDTRLGVVVHTGWGATLAPLTNIHSNYPFLTSTISKINHGSTPGMPKTSGTNIAAGLLEALNVFNTGSTPARPKAIVLVSDGEPTSNSGGMHPTLTSHQLLLLAREVADDAWSESIHVYVVFYNRTNSAAAADNLRSLIRGSGTFIQTSNAADLPQHLRQLSRSMSIVLLQ